MLKAFLKEGSLYTLSTLLSAGIGIFLIPFYTRAFTPSDYGTLEILNVLSNTLAILCTLEISSALAKYYGEHSANPSELKKYVSTGFYFTIGSLILCFLIVFLLKEQASSILLKDSRYSDILIYSLLAFLCSRTFGYFINLLRFGRQSIKYVVFSIINSLLSISLTVYLVLFMDSGISGIFFAGICISILLGPFLIYSVKDLFSTTFSTSALKELLKFSLPLVISSLSLTVLNYTDRILINEYLSLNDLGLYSLGYKLSNFMGIILTGFSSALAPLIYNNYKDENTPVEIAKIFRWFIFFMFIAIAGISCFSKELLIVFTQPAYYDSYCVVPFLLGVNLFSYLGYFFPGLFLSGATKWIAVINITGAFINIGLNVLLIPEYGIAGASLSTLISTIITSVCVIVLSQKKYHLPISFSRLLPGLILTVFVCTVPYFSDSGVMWVLIKSFIMLSFIVLIYYLNVLSPDDKRLLIKKIKELGGRIKGNYALVKK